MRKRFFSTLMPYQTDEDDGSKTPAVAAETDRVPRKRAAHAKLETPPLRDPRTEDAVRRIANELNQLSMQEREKVMFDLHGISPVFQENTEPPHLIAQKLRQFQITLDQIVEKKAYELAATIDFRYVKNQRFRLSFLRADQMDAVRAANRFVRYFEIKLNLFGINLLAQDITQDDLCPDALKFLYGGWAQDSPVRDRSGRLVLCIFNKQQDRNISLRAKLQRVFYANEATIRDDEETQRKGRVSIFWATEGAPMDRTLAWNLARMISSLPVHYSAFHVCFPPNGSTMLSQMVAMAQFATDMFYRLRVRTHTGTVKELKFILQTFGINTSALAIRDDGEISLDSHRERWAKFRREERMRSFNATALPSSPGPTSDTSSASNKSGIKSPVNRIDTPKINDVLLGRETTSTQHLGNLTFRILVEEYRQRYESATKTGKSTIAYEIVDIIHARKGRFLRDDGNGWVEADDLSARQKVASCFRFYRKSERQKRAATANA